MLKNEKWFYFVRDAGKCAPRLVRNCSQCRVLSPRMNFAKERQRGMSGVSLNFKANDL